MELDQKRIGKRFRNVRKMKIGTNIRIRKALVRPAEHFIIHNRKEEIENVKNGQGARCLGKSKKSGKDEYRAVGHGKLPKHFPRKHFQHGKPERIRQRIEKYKQNCLQKKGETRDKNKRIFE